MRVGGLREERLVCLDRLAWPLRLAGVSSLLDGNAAVVGMQWGDEGKGKIVDYIAESADLVVRYCGGANAGTRSGLGTRSTARTCCRWGSFGRA